MVTQETRVRENMSSLFKKVINFLMKKSPFYSGLSHINDTTINTYNILVHTLVQSQKTNDFREGPLLKDSTNLVLLTLGTLLSAHGPLGHRCCMCDRLLCRVRRSSNAQRRKFIILILPGHAI